MPEQPGDLEKRRAYRRLFCATEEPYKTYAETVLADLLDECGVLNTHFQFGGTQGDNNYLTGRYSIGLKILENCGITDIKKITSAIMSVLPEDIELQETADSEDIS